MWEAIIDAILGILKLFGIGAGKSDTQAGMETGEKLGQAETGKATDDKIIQDVSDANAARQSVRDDPGGVRGPDEFSRD